MGLKMPKMDILENSHKFSNSYVNSLLVFSTRNPLTVLMSLNDIFHRTCYIWCNKFQQDHWYAIPRSTFYVNALITRISTTQFKYSFVKLWRIEHLHFFFLHIFKIHFPIKRKSDVGIAPTLSASTPAWCRRIRDIYYFACNVLITSILVPAGGNFLYPSANRLLYFQTNQVDTTHRDYMCK